LRSVLSAELTDEISALKRPVNSNLMRNDFASGLNSSTAIKIRNTIVDKFFNQFRLISCFIAFPYRFFLIIVSAIFLWLKGLVLI
jgi:hypothetical protein